MAAQGSGDHAAKGTVFARQTAIEAAMCARIGWAGDSVCTATASDFFTNFGLGEWTDLGGLSNFDMPAIQPYQHSQSVSQIRRSPIDNRRHACQLRALRRKACRWGRMPDPVESVPSDTLVGVL